jgi:hypothetical protein
VKKLLASLIILFICSTAYATDYYVTTSGNDGNGGTNDTSDAWLTISNCVDTVSDGDRCCVKSGTYTEAFNATDDDVGTNGTVSTIEGYLSTCGDAPTDTDRPLIDAESTRTSCGALGLGWQIKHFRCDGSTQSGFTFDAGARFENIYINSANWQALRSETFVGINVEMTGGGGGTFGAGKCIGCYAHDNSADGFGDSIGGNDLVDCFYCISDTNGADGFRFGRHSTIMNSIAYNNTGDGIDNGADGTTNLHCALVNNITQDNGGYGFNRDSTDQNCYFDYNVYYSDTTGTLNNITAGDNDVGNSDPLMNAPASGDFTITSSSPAENAGFPQSINGATGDYNNNIGVDQSKPSSGGAAATTAHTYVN